MTLLSVRGLAVSTSDRLLVKDAGFDIAPGQWLALVGESGSGKSLTALSILGLLPAGLRAQGSVTLQSEELLNAPEPQLRRVRGKRVGMIFQEPMSALNPLHSIGRQIGEAVLVHAPGTSRAVWRARVQELLGQVGLFHLQSRTDAFPHQLSGGERQRVMIAIAISNNPQLLIADEPTTAVDVTVQATILELLKKLQAELGMALLFITHDLTLVQKRAERVAVMREGQIVEIGTVKEVFGAPRHPYTRHLLASAPQGEAAALAAHCPKLVACEALKVYYPIKSGLLRRTTGYVKAVDDVSLTLSEGETLGLVGESGSGKTTLGFALLRLTPSQGRIMFLGKDITALQGSALKKLRPHMQPVFQDPYGSLNPRMNVQSLLEEGLRVHERGLSAHQRIARVEAALAEVGLTPDMRERYPHAFSGGQRQRLSIARALILKPRFIVLDEPTSALDLSVQAQLLALLKDLQARHGLAYLFISHDLRVVRAIAHRIAVLKEGRLVEQNATHALLNSPKEAYTRQLIAAALLRD
ncbi:MAG: ABC transporter ATP-binding protein [Alphaproteobacteria bacterium]|nr:ABC transporter ATP-binding protein [Alphaproteobacteria bacterium]